MTKRNLIAIVVTLLSAVRVDAALKPAGIFGDHMVVQTGVPLPVWGKADAGSQVVVAIGDVKQSTYADAAGRWQVEFPPIRGETPLTMTITAGNDSTTFADVLVGEVWLGSGQSNMAFTLDRAKDAEAEIADADYPQIRVFTVKKNLAAAPTDDIEGEWRISSPKTAATFSAAGYFFARDIHQAIKKPVGVIVSAVGAAAAESFIRRESLLADPKLKSLVETADARNKALPAIKAKYEADHAAWEQKMRADGKADVLTKPRTPQQAKDLAEPRPSAQMNDFQYASFIANGMLTPLAPYPVRGVLWYQGEHHARHPESYRDLLTLVVKDFRDQWHREDLPFIVVQLPNQGKRVDAPGASGWAVVREAQAFVGHDVPNVHLITTIDIGEENVHPVDKQDVGKRLALQAIKHVYQHDVVADAPMFVSAAAEGDSVRVKCSVNALHATGGAPRGFTIAGADQKFMPAAAKIDADGSIVVRASSVAVPVAVRYAWADNPDCNVFGPGDLPLAPFRTDDWQVTTPADEK